MSIEIDDQEKQRQLENKWDIYYSQLSERVQGEPSEEGKLELKKLWLGRKKIENMFFTGELKDQKERGTARYELTKEWRENNEDLFGKDEAFSEAYDIVLDESG